MRRTGVVLGSVAAAVAFTAGCGSSSSKHDDTTTLRFVWRQSGERLAVDLPPRGKVNRGDVIRARSTLRNAVAQLGRPRGAIVGHELATFHVVSPRKATVRIRLTIPGGGFDARGAASTAPWHGPLTVSGGRGRFAGARGTGLLRQFFARSTVVFRIELPNAS